MYIYTYICIYFTHTSTEGNVKGSTPALLSLLFGRHGRACVGEDRYHHADVACVCVCVDRRMRENCQRDLSTQKETSNKDISTKKNTQKRDPSIRRETNLSKKKPRKSIVPARMEVRAPTTKERAVRRPDLKSQTDAPDAVLPPVWLTSTTMMTEKMATNIAQI